MNMTFFQRRQPSSQAEDDALRHLSSSLGRAELEKEQSHKGNRARKRQREGKELEKRCESGAAEQR